MTENRQKNNWRTKKISALIFWNASIDYHILVCHFCLSLFCWQPFYEILKSFSTIWTFLQFWPLQSLFKNWGELDLSVLLPKLFAKFKNLEQEQVQKDSANFLRKMTVKNQKNAISCHLLSGSCHIQSVEIVVELCFLLIFKVWTNFAFWDTFNL